MNPWLTQDLAAQRRAEMVKAATQWHMTHQTRRPNVRWVAGRWLIAAGQFVAGPQKSPAPYPPDLARPVVRLGN